MDAIVLVGGEGTRLRPVTYDVPKQLLPVVDRPMIEHVVGWLVRHGIERVVLSVGYRPVAWLEAFPGDEVAGARLAYAVEPELLDTAGAVRFAAESAGVDDTFLVLNGDVLSDFDITGLVVFHKDSGAEATIQLTPVADPSSFGVVPTDPAGRVTAFIEKPPPGTAPTNRVNAGCYVLEPSVLSSIPGGRRVSIERETFPAIVAAGRLYALSSDAYWLDTGTPANYLRASRDILEGHRPDCVRPAVPERGEGLFVHPEAIVEGLLGRGSYLGSGARVSAGAELTESVLSDLAALAPGARVAGSMLMAGAEVGEGARVESSVIGPGASIGAGSRVVGYSVVGGGAVVPDGAVLEAARYPAP
jgi:mannose-1-phosphate guanylyltransferase